MNKQGAIEVGARLPSHKEDLGDLTVTIVRRRFVAAPSGKWNASLSVLRVAFFPNASFFRSYACPNTEQDKTLHESRRSLTGVERGGSVCRCACHFVTPVTNSAGVSSSHPHQEDKALNPRSSLETSLNAASQLPQPTTSKVAAHQNDAVSHRRATVTFLGKLSDAELPACALNSAQRSPATVEQQEIYHPNTTAAKLDPWDSQLGRPPPELEPKGWICMETAGSPEVLLYIHGYNNSHTEVQMPIIDNEITPTLHYAVSLRCFRRSRYKFWARWPRLETTLLTFVYFCFPGLLEKGFGNFIAPEMPPKMPRHTKLYTICFVLCETTVCPNRLLV